MQLGAGERSVAAPPHVFVLDHMFYYSPWTVDHREEHVMRGQQHDPVDDETEGDRVWADPLGHVVHLHRVEAHPVHWLSPGRLAAGKITVLDGDPGLGKSTLLCECAARITRGQALPGGKPGAPRNVIILSAEDDLHDTIRPRIDAAGGDPSRIA